MKIELHELQQTTIEQFAQQHDLTMEVHERNRIHGSPSRFYAHFKDAEIKDGSILIGAFGDGPTHEHAIREYASKISNTTLVIAAYKPIRREIEVPILC